MTVTHNKNKKLAPLQNLQEARKIETMIVNKYKARDLVSKPQIISQSPQVNVDLFGKKSRDIITSPTVKDPS